MDAWFLAFFLLHSAISIYLHSLIGLHQPTSYMDEEFHVAQAQVFCNGSLQWDPKITTPPGLYLPNVLLSHLLKIAGFEEMAARSCKIESLRFVNVVFAALNYCVIYSILGSFRLETQQKSNAKQLKHRLHNFLLSFEAFAIIQFPNLHFYTMMYYTDPGSTFCLLLLVKLHLQNCDKFSSQIATFLVGFLSLTFRQTNLIWLFCLAVQRCLSIVNSHFAGVTKKSDDESRDQGVFRWLFFCKFQDKLTILVQCIGRNWPHVANAVISVVFIWYNNGLALGHRENHEVVLHSVQLCYLVLFTSCYLAPLFGAGDAFSILNSVRKAPIRFTLLLLVTFAAVEYNSLVHAFVLADNRHYFFYIHSRLLSKQAVKLALAPVYVLAALALWQLQKAESRGFRLDKVTFAICAALAVVPHRLVEPRYFVPPFLLFRVLLRPAAFGPEAKRWIAVARVFLESVVYATVQAITVYIFFFRSFAQDGEVRRFMW